MERVLIAMLCLLGSNYLWGIYVSPSAANCHLQL